MRVTNRRFRVRDDPVQRDVGDVPAVRAEGAEEDRRYVRGRRVGRAAAGTGRDRECDESCRQNWEETEPVSDTPQRP